MKYQPNKDYKSDDVVFTPGPLAWEIVNHFKPTGVVLEPCKGAGIFLEYLPAGTLWCEISEGRDFFEFHDKVDWIVINPPWSKMMGFLKHGMQVATNIVYLVTVNHLWTKARVREIRAAGFGIKEIMTCAHPSSFPSSGFQLAVIHLQLGWTGPITLSQSLLY